jgi:hypothetical protein
MDTNNKNEEIYKTYQKKMPEEVIENRTLRVKLIRFYIKNFEINKGDLILNSLLIHQH